MRGIAGILHLDGQPVSRENLLSLARAMTPGPVDRVADSCVDAAGLVHVQRDLAPEDRLEAQPLRGTDGDLLLVTDALLENRAELAAEFGWSAVEAAARPDSAFVLAAYEKWGDRCPTQLEGQWAFAVWHARERRLFAAVDAFSFRPFYYFHARARLAFATTLNALFSLPETPRELDDGVLADFLLYTRPEPGRTLYRGLRILPAAHLLRCDARGVKLERYWRADPRRQVRFDSDADYVAAFRAELERAVAAGLRATGEVGIMLSGGLDSASITAVAGRMLAERGRRLQAIHQLPTPGDPRGGRLLEHDESAHVRRLQAHLPHVDFHFDPPPDKPARFSLERWEARFAEHGVPLHGGAFEPAAPRPQRNLAQMLFGFGGNYAASLEAYPSAYFAQLAVQGRWLRLSRELSGHARFYGPTVRHLIKYRVLLPLLGRDAGPDDRVPLLEFFHDDFVGRAQLQAKLSGPRGRRWTAADFSVKRGIAWILDELMPQNVGAAPAMIGREYRCSSHAPLMTRRLNEFCLAVPVDQHIRDGRDRLLLRRAMAGLLPDEIIWRKTRGFPAAQAWPTARALLAVLPAALDELEKSPRAAATLNLPLLRRRFIAGDAEAELRRVGAGRFMDLMTIAWFLRWHERQAG